MTKGEKNKAKRRIITWSRDDQKTPNTPLNELVEAINDEDYDPNDPRPRKEQKDEAEFDRAEQKLQEDIEAGRVEMIELPVENAPKDFNFVVRMIKRKEDGEE
jgi:hypothetical protein